MSACYKHNWNSCTAACPLCSYNTEVAKPVFAGGYTDKVATLEAQLDAARAEIERLKTAAGAIVIDNRFEILDMRTQRDRYRAALEEISRVGDGRGSNTHVIIARQALGSGQGEEEK